MRAVVFAYHNVGVRCLSVLLAHGVKIDLVLTHQDNPKEKIWFESVADLCLEHGIPVETPETIGGPLQPGWEARLHALSPDYIFSFYYRNMLPASVLKTAKIAALNMHGSLLPKYRGRVPVNWAIVHGEHETGASLHVMEAKPDAGDIVAQQRVPILPDDTAKQVFDKVCLAAELALDSAMPDLLVGKVQRRLNDLTQGSYFGGRKPEDGRIDLEWPSARIYNLIRAVADPYPGAYLDSEQGRRLWIDGARPVRDGVRLAQLRQACQAAEFSQTKPLLTWQGKDYLALHDGSFLEVKLRAGN